MTIQRRQGRPAAQDVEQLNDLILTTARAAFIEEGYDNASVEKIASVAGIGKVTIYRRYASKKELFIAVLESMSVGISNIFESFEKATPQPLEVLKERCRLILNLVSTQEGVETYRVLITVGKRFPDVVAVTSERMIDPIEDKNQELLLRAQQLGQIRPDVDIADVNRALSGLLTGWTLLNSLLGKDGLHDDTQRSGFFETVWGIFIRGLRA
jgi:TetR/AcrR family transcriptional regulator of autoinduction and epiphytic fitness